LNFYGFYEPQAARFSQAGTNCRSRLAVWYIQGGMKSSKSGLEGNRCILYQSAALAGKKPQKLRFRQRPANAS